MDTPCECDYISFVSPVGKIGWEQEDVAELAITLYPSQSLSRG